MGIVAKGNDLATGQISNLDLREQWGYTLSNHDDAAYFTAKFKAMASPCEFLINTQDTALAHQLAQKGLQEVRRIEKKFSRYHTNNLCHSINHANGDLIEIDSECYRLLDFANTCYELSEGLFDLTSGVLRRAWVFDCSDNIPSQEKIDTLLPLIGWRKVKYTHTTLQMPAGMELDFGGIGKEYAGSRVVDIFLSLAPNVSVLVNLGGDIQITTPKANQAPWRVGIENHQHIIPITQGALATSGDAKKYLLKNGTRYSHILNPKTGWPVQRAPASITIHAPLCIQAGCLATLALLQGGEAEAFLKEQNIQYWCTR